MDKGQNAFSGQPLDNGTTDEDTGLVCTYVKMQPVKEIDSLTVSYLHYLFSSAPEYEGCALSPDAPALPGSQLLPTNDLRTQTQRNTRNFRALSSRSSSKSICTQLTTSVLNINS